MSTSDSFKYCLRFGTTSEFIPPQHRPTLKDANTHKWRLYLRGPPDNPDPSFLVKSCRIVLDESYAPGHDITLTSYPFHLSRRGFSGFDIEIEIQLWGPNNRLISFKHPLTLTNVSDKERVELETEIELLLQKEDLKEESDQVAKKVTSEATNVATPNAMEDVGIVEGVQMDSKPIKATDVGKEIKPRGGKKRKIGKIEKKEISDEEVEETVASHKRIGLRGKKRKKKTLK